MNNCLLVFSFCFGLSFSCDVRIWDAGYVSNRSAAVFDLTPSLSLATLWRAWIDFNATAQDRSLHLLLSDSAAASPFVTLFKSGHAIKACSAPVCDISCDACVAPSSSSPTSGAHAALAVLKSLNASRVVLVSDRAATEKGWSLPEFAARASDLLITHVSFRADERNLSLTLRSFVEDFDWKHRYFVVICKEETTKKLLEEVTQLEQSFGLLNRQFFWIILSPIQDQGSLLNQLPHFSNVMLIHRRLASCFVTRETTIPSWIRQVRRVAATCASCNAMCREQVLEAGGCHPKSTDVELFATATEKTKDQLSTKWARVGKFFTTNYSIHASMPLFPNTFVDFGGQMLKIATAVYVPFVIETNKNFTHGNVTCHLVKGALMDAVDIIAENLNFTTCYVYAPDGLYGNYDYASGKASGMIGMAYRREVSFVAAGMTASFQRAQAVEFSVPFMNEGSGIIIRKQPSQRSMFQVLAPFHWQIWLALSCVLSVLGSIQWCVTQVSPFNGVAMKLRSENADDLHLKHNVWNTFGIMLDQGQEISPLSHSTRINIVVYWFFCLMVINLYSAELITYMTLEDTRLPIKNFEDLSNQKEIRPLLLNETFLSDYLKTSKSRADQRVFKMLPTHLPSSDTDSIKMVRNSVGGKWAFMGDYKWLLTLEAEDCANLVLLSEAFNAAAFLALAFPKNSYYADKINPLLQALTENGYIDKAYEKWFKQVIGRPCIKASLDTSAGFQVIELKTLLGTWMIYASFVAIAVLAAAAECLWRRYRRDTKPSQRRVTVNEEDVTIL